MAISTCPYQTSTRKYERTCTIFEPWVLGLILLLVYINALPQDIISQVRLFVDDTAIYLTIENKNDSEILQRDLDRLQAWESKWDKEFNTSKCQVIRVQGLFQIFWEKAPGLNWEKYAAFWEFFRSVKQAKKRLTRA